MDGTILKGRDNFQVTAGAARRYQPSMACKRRSPGYRALPALVVLYRLRAAHFEA